MHLNEETLRNITIRKTKRNFRLSFNTETVSPTFVEEYYPRIGDTPVNNINHVPVINDYDELNSILQRESEQRSVFSQDVGMQSTHKEENLQGSPPKLRKLLSRNKKARGPISEENVMTKSRGDTNSKTPAQNQTNSKKPPCNVSDEPSPTPSHETIDFPLSPNRRSTSDSGETFFDPAQITEQGQSKHNNKLETEQANAQPEQDSSETILCNITYRTKRRIMPDPDSPNPLPPPLMRNYAKSMADIFTDSTMAERIGKSYDSGSKHSNQVETISSPKHSHDNLEKRDTCDQTLSLIQDKAESERKNNLNRNKHRCKKDNKINGNHSASGTIKRNYFLRSKLGEFIDSIMSNGHKTSISKRSTEQIDEDSGCNSETVESVQTLRDRRKPAVSEGKKEIEVPKKQTENCNEVQYLGTTTIDEDAPSEWSRIVIRRKKRPLATPSKPALNPESTTSKASTPSKTPLKLCSESPQKGLFKTPPKPSSGTLRKTLSKTPIKSYSKTSLKAHSKTPFNFNRKPTDCTNAQTVEIQSDINPVVLLSDRDIVYPSPLNRCRALRNQSVQTQSSESSIETIPVKLLNEVKTADKANHNVREVQTVGSVFCQSCQKKTKLAREKNCGSYELQDDEDDFVSNEVSNLSGIGRLEVRSENYRHTKRQGDGAGNLMRGVLAFVDIKLDGSDKSRGVIQILNHLGAQISKSLHKNVTHVIFYEGALATVEKATQWSIPVVSVKWVNACKNSRLLLCPEAFPPVHIEDYMDSIKQNKDELFKTVLRTLAKDLDDLVASDASLDDIQMPLSILILRKYVTPYEADSEHIYNLASIEISLALDRRKRALLRRLVFPHRATGSSESTDGSDWTLSPVVLEPRCSAPARLCSRKPRSKATRVSRELQFEGEVEKIRSILGTQKKDSEKKRGARTDERRDKAGKEQEEATQKKQDFFDALNRLRAPTKTPNKNKTSHNIEPRPSKPKAATPHLLAKKRIHFRRSSVPDRLTPGGAMSQRTPHSSPCEKRVQSVDWRSGSALISSSEMPEAPGKRKIRKRRLYDDASFEEPLQSVKKKTPKRKPRTDLHKGKLFPFDALIKEQKYSDVYDTNRSEKPQNDSSRSSSYWFVSQSETVVNKSRNPNRLKPGIVCTGINSKDIKSLYSYITELGNFVLEAKVTARTTHVVVEGPKRTLNLLKGIARGCWIVKREWVHASFSVGRWLYEQRFELSSFSPAVQRCRMERQTFGSLYAFDILSKVGPIFVSKNSRPPRADLQELIALCGGRLAPTMREANIVLGGEGRTGSRHHLSETWLLDCVTRCSQLSIEKYRIS